MALLVASAVQAFAHTQARVGFDVRTYSLSGQIAANNVTSIARTSDGYLWLGTPSGLFRFNGERTIEATAILDVPRLRVQTLRARGATLYVGTSGQGVYQISGTTVSKFDTTTGLNDNVVWDMAAGVGGQLWIGTSAGVSVLQDGQLRAVPDSRSIVSHLASDMQGGVWVVNNRGELSHHAPGQSARLARDGDRVFALMSQPDGRIWLGTEQGVFVSDGPDQPFVLEADVDGEIVVALARTSTGDIWAATIGGELWQRTQDGWQHRHIAQRLPNARINTMWVDAEDGLWLGTRAGLVQITGGAVVELGPTLSGPDVWAVTHDRDGRLWMASDGGGIRQVDADALELIPMSLSLPSAEIWALSASPEGGLWAGSGDAGAFLIRDGQVKKHITDLPIPQVWSILELPDGQLLIGTDGAGLVRVDADGSHVFNRESGLAGDRVWALRQSSTRQLWVGTNLGLCSIENNVATCLDSADGLPGDAVWAIEPTHDGRLWVSTDGGLACVGHDGTIAAVTREPLASANVFGTIYDSAGDLWAVSDQGLHHVRREQLDELLEPHNDKLPLGRTYGPADGLQQTLQSGASPAITLDAKGGLWLATEGGLALVQTDLLRDKAVPVTLRFEFAEIDGQRRALSDASITIEPQSRVVRVSYTAMSFRYPEATKVQHRLRGSSELWSEPTLERQLIFSNLPPGEYVLEIRLAPNSYGLVSPPAALTIAVQPLWHQKTLTRVLLLLLLAGGLALLYYYRMRALTARHSEREELMGRELAASRAVRESQKQYQDIFANVTDLVFSVGQDKLIVAANPEAQRLLPGCQIGRPISNMLPPEGLANSARAPWRWPVTTSDGATRTIELRCTDGTNNSLLFVGRDMTDQIVLQEQVSAAQRIDAIGKLTAGVAHDFNNLLTVIHGNASMLVEQLNEPRAAANANAIVDAADRAADITSKLLSFGRRQTVRQRRIDINAHLRGMESLLHTAVAENIRLTLNLTGEPVVLADTGLLEQIVLNLVVNARDAIGDRGQIDISTMTVTLDDSFTARHPGSRTGTHLRLRIVDNGQGMDRATAERAFEPFFSTKDPSSGTGLGLATVYGAVKQCGGVVYIHSTPGKGTRVDVYLPITQGPADTLDKPATQSLQTGTEKVLVVDDDPQVRDLTRAILAQGGYQVSVAAGVEDAEQVFATQTFDLLVADVVMTDGSGTQLAERLRARDARLPVLFMSGYSHSHLPALNDSDAELLMKPFRVVQLLKAVRRALDGGSPGETTGNETPRHM